MKILDKKTTVYPNDERHQYWVLVDQTQLVLRHAVLIAEQANIPTGTEYTKQQLDDINVDTGTSAQESFFKQDGRYWVVTTNIVQPSLDGNMSGDCTTIVWTVNDNSNTEMSFNVYDFNKMWPGYQGSTPYSILKRNTKYIFVLYRSYDAQSLLDCNWVVHSGTGALQIHTNLDFDTIIEEDDDANIRPEYDFVFTSEIVEPTLNEDQTISFKVQIYNQLGPIDTNTSITIAPLSGTLVENRPFTVTNGLSEVINIKPIGNQHALFDVSILYGTYLSSRRIDVI